ncbi:putative Sphingomyelin phosphodiesterase 4 [Hypsibius exemplaris]|uniref:Sphingomyelin phosphodiesterase 4 n=1 Tax=Hypsibius exemplaris TaxID=2072580 RepID=A0A1W0X3Y3_HYPEX|nr:putative Sphingomyelin phosphodiesterase 4 [Hypsibius exemplaris]
MGENYPSYYAPLRSGMYPTQNGNNAHRKSVQFAGGTSETSQPDPRRLLPPNGNFFTRETVSDLYGMPLDMRFAKINQMLQRSDVRDIQEIFQPVVEAIFGFRAPSAVGKVPGAGQGSQLNGTNQPYIPVSFCDITIDYRLVYEAGHGLLNTLGPVMRFLLAVSPNRGTSMCSPFNFPVACLPYAVQSSLENGVIPPWYRDKVFSAFGGGGLDDAEPPEYIALSAFDFYFAHFAYHLVNPDIRTNNSAHPQCLYMALIDDYSSVFFNANTIMENQRLLSTTSSSTGYARRSQHGLFSSLRDFGTEKPLEPASEQQRPQPHPLATSESMESLINIFVEFWLNMSGFSSQRYGRKYYSYSGASSDRTRLSPTFGQSSAIYSPANKRRLNATHNVPTVFPPVCALQGFRQIVKAIHEFIYAPAVNPRNQKNLETSLLDMKRHIVPQLIQRPLYDLLKTTMKKYPMDASFRFVYELWLTYIQPWRYEAVTAENSGEAIVICKEQRWSTFITENLLFYSTVLQAFVDRMLRVDFGVPFNALAVFRVSKVFHDSDMYDMVMNVEDVVLGVKKANATQLGFSPGKSTVRNHFADLEDSTFRYVPLRSVECIAKVTLLLRTLMTEERRCQRKRQEQLSPLPTPETAPMGYWKKFALDTARSLFGLLAGPIDVMQLRPEELDRMSKQIQLSVQHLCAIFEIEKAEITETELSRTTSVQREFLLDQDLSTKTAESSFKAPSRSRSQIRRHSIPNWMDEEKVPYLTEPEKRLPRSWEFECLIPLLNALSVRINAEYGQQVVQWYNGRDLLSRLVHPLIEPPHHPAVRYGEPANLPTLPARINLRPLASKYLIGSLFFFWFFIWVFDIGLLRGVFWMLALPAFLLLANALLEPFRDSPDGASLLDQSGLRN